MPSVAGGGIAPAGRRVRRGRKLIFLTRGEKSRGQTHTAECLNYLYGPLVPFWTRRLLQFKIVPAQQGGCRGIKVAVPRGDGFCSLWWMGVGKLEPKALSFDMI